MTREEESAHEWCKQNGYVMMPEGVYEQDITKAYFEGQNIEPCEDAISRKAVLDYIYNSWKHNGVGENYGELSIDALKALPPVTPKQKMGRWIPVSERLPEDRDWNLAVFREKDTGYQCIPRVASYVGHDMWIVIDADSVDRGWFSDLECIAWMPLPEPYVPETNVGKMAESTEYYSTIKEENDEP